MVGEDLKRVEQANKLYKFTAELICALERCKVAWSVENPTSSLFWKTSFMQKAAAEMVDTLAVVDFDMCMHGGGRKKRTTFMHGATMFKRFGHQIGALGPFWGPLASKKWSHFRPKHLVGMPTKFGELIWSCPSILDGLYRG